MAKEWIDPATGSQILEDDAATKEYIHPAGGVQIIDAEVAAAGGSNGINPFTGPLGGPFTGPV